MKNYQTPSVQVVLLPESDIIATSTLIFEVEDDEVLL